MKDQSCVTCLTSKLVFINIWYIQPLVVRQSECFWSVTTNYAVCCLPNRLALIFSARCKQASSILYSSVAENCWPCHPKTESSIDERSSNKQFSEIKRRWDANSFLSFTFACSREFHQLTLKSVNSNKNEVNSARNRYNMSRGRMSPVWECCAGAWLQLRRPSHYHPSETFQYMPHTVEEKLQQSFETSAGFAAS